MKIILGWARKNPRGAQTRETAVREHLVLAADRDRAVLYTACSEPFRNPQAAFKAIPTPGAACHRCLRSRARDLAKGD